MSSVEIVSRLCNIGEKLTHVDQNRVANLVTEHGLYGAARIMGYDVSHYENLLISGRLAMEHLRRNCPPTLLEYAKAMITRLNKPTYDFMVKYHKQLQTAIDKNSDYDYDHDWFSGNTMITTYSAKVKYGESGIETPQYTWMRVAVQLYHDSDSPLKDVLRCYEELAVGYYTGASPTLFNSGMREPQMASCFLQTVNDSLESIMLVLLRGALVSKANGGLGFDISRVRHSEIRETGYSQGIVPMLQLYNYMVRYVDQGSFRKGACTIFLRPHHIDVEDFIDLPRKVGDKYARAHDINICLWTSWIFWERIRTDGEWTLFCPARVPQLNDLYGVEFTKAYIAAEKDTSILPHHRKVIRARDLFDKMRSNMRECGMPYCMDGDACNLKSNQRNLGYISGSNLCLEIVEYTDENTIAVCNLHSLSLRMFAKGPVKDRNVPVATHPDIKASDPASKILRECIDFKHLAHISRRVTENLNRVIDHNWYPLDKIVDGKVKPKIINKSNKRHRPVGMGVSGFAEMLHILDLPFEHPLVSQLNKMVFACMYWNALAQSVQLAIKEGHYESFPGSPSSHGLLQFDLWAEEFSILGPNATRKASDDIPLEPSVWGQEPHFLYTADNSSVQDVIQPTWTDLKRCIVKYGLRNSLLIALMPTASTAQIRRNCESVEAHQSNLYSRKVLKCSYPVLNRYMVEDLQALGVWNNESMEYLQIQKGSIQGIASYVNNNKDKFPEFNGDLDRLQFLQKKYLTMYELPQKIFMNLAAERGRYIDQSASTNVYIQSGDDQKLKAVLLYAQMLGLKTLMYYFRQEGGQTINFTSDPSLTKYIKGLNVKVIDVEKEKAKDEAKLKSLIEDAKEIASVPIKKSVVCTDEVCMSCQ